MRRLSPPLPPSLTSPLSCCRLHGSGQIVDLTQNAHRGHFPWKEHLFQVEKDLGVEGDIKFVLFTDDKDKWRVQSVPKTSASFELRVGLLQAWRGLRGQELAAVSGVPDAIFVHASGFIGGAGTRDSVLQMACKSLEAVAAV